MHRCIEMLIFPHNQRIVSTHFQRENFLRLCGKLLVQLFARLRATGKEQAIDARVCGQCDAGIASALQQIEDTGRQTRLRPDFDRGLRAAGYQFAWLEYHTIARDECGNNMAIWQVTRKIVWTEHRDNPVRAMP